MRKTKIVCTIGPASEDSEVFTQLLDAGMNVARFNFSHGTHESHRRAIQQARKLAASRGVVLAILVDLQGPRIRIGQIRPEGILLEPGQTVRVWAGKSSPDSRVGVHFGSHTVAESYQVDLPVTYLGLARDVKPGARIFIDDGRIELSVLRVDDSKVECRVVSGGRVLSSKGVNLPDSSIAQATLTEKDLLDLQFAIEERVDYVALSFVRRPEDILQAKAILDEKQAAISVIAKIERPEAVDHLPAILKAADGIMVARGDLGVEMGPETVPILQKRMIHESNQQQGIVITATQMLESMTSCAHPTRAEVSDVANAIFDGTDAVMLSAETSIGRYPVEAVKVMDRIICATEEEVWLQKRMDPEPWAPSSQSQSFPRAICEAAARAAQAIGATAIVVCSESGRTARLISKYHLHIPIYAFTSDETVRRRMALYSGIIPLTIPPIVDAAARVDEMQRQLQQHDYVQSGDRFVVLSGMISGELGGSHSLKLHEVPC